METKHELIDRVRRALKRDASSPVPPPPVLHEPTVRLVHTDFGLSELFAKRAEELKMLVELVSPEQVAMQMIQFLAERKILRTAMANSKLLDNLQIAPSLVAAGIEVKRWSEISLDEMYDFDCAITDTTYAVAETGSLAIVTDASNGRALSLTPLVHIAVVEPKNLVADLLDLFELLNTKHRGRHVVMISGPSKTADIEMNVVTGVHGPNVVKTFVIN